MDLHPVLAPVEIPGESGQEHSCPKTGGRRVVGNTRNLTIFAESLTASHFMNGESTWRYWEETLTAAFNRQREKYSLFGRTGTLLADAYRPRVVVATGAYSTPAHLKLWLPPSPSFLASQRPVGGKYLHAMNLIPMYLFLQLPGPNMYGSPMYAHV